MNSRLIGIIFAVPFTKNLVISACDAAIWLVVYVSPLAHAQVPRRMKRLSSNAQVLDIDCALKMSYLVRYVAALVVNVTVMVFGHQLKSKVYRFFIFLRIALFYTIIIINNINFN